MSEIWYYFYEVCYYESADKLKASGLTYGESLAHAISHITDIYGENEVESVNIKIIGDGGTCIEIKDIEETLKEWEK